MNNDSGFDLQKLVESVESLTKSNRGVSFNEEAVKAMGSVAGIAQEEVKRRKRNNLLYSFKESFIWYTLGIGTGLSIFILIKPNSNIFWFIAGGVFGIMICWKLKIARREKK